MNSLNFDIRNGMKAVVREGGVAWANYHIDPMFTPPVSCKKPLTER